MPDWTDPDDTERFHKCSDDRIHASGAMMTGSLVSSMINPGDWTKVRMRKKTASTARNQRLSGSLVGPLNDSDSVEWQRFQWALLADNGHVLDTLEVWLTLLAMTEKSRATWSQRKLEAWRRAPFDNRSRSELVPGYRDPLTG